MSKTMAIELCSVQVGEPRDHLDPEPWTTAFYKDKVTGPIRLSRLNLAGDRQADLTVHGGVDKAVCVYTDEHYARWKQELGVDDCGPGWFGENFTVKELSEETACIGDVYSNRHSCCRSLAASRAVLEAGAAMEPSRLAQARSALESNGLVFPRHRRRRGCRRSAARAGEPAVSELEHRSGQPSDVSEVGVR